MDLHSRTTVPRLTLCGRIVPASDVTVDCANQYASVVVVALDDRSIATSRRLLVQVGTVCRPTGWRERPIRIPVKEGFVEGSRIIDVGTSPWRVEKARGQIAVRNPAITKATVLDVNGMPVADLPITKDGGVVKLALPENALYICLLTLSLQE